MARTKRSPRAVSDRGLSVLIEEADREAMRIAGSLDTLERTRLLVIAKKVAQAHPAFARDLLTAAESAIEAWEGTCLAIPEAENERHGAEDRL